MSRVRRVVVKVGTAVLAGRDGRLSAPRVHAISSAVARLVEGGRRIVLVTSGAIGTGVGELGLAERPEKLARLQALASLGQSLLIQLYERALRRAGLHAGQILVTRGTFEDRTAYLNVRRTVASLESYGAVAIINENDSVSTDEIRLGDNDILSAMVTNLLGAELLVLLTCVDGLLDEDGNVLSEVHDINAALHLVRAGTSRLGTGGMGTKLEAARMVTRSGEAVVIANGLKRNVLDRILAGKPEGTLFWPGGSRLKGKKRWLRFSGKVAGRITADDGARAAVIEGGKSLLASGVTDVQGDFKAGELVAVLTASGHEFARGIARFSASEVLKIRGLKSREIETLLGRRASGIVVHRDNLVVVD